MASIKLANEFTIELTNELGVETVLKGAIRELTKDEKKEYDWLSSRLKEVQKIGIEIGNIESRISLLKDKLVIQESDKKESTIDELGKLNEKLLELNLKTLDLAVVDNDDLVKKRLETTILGPDSAKIVNIGESIGYSELLRVITTAVEEAKEKK